ncbi:hypothetical protein MPER_11015, partial [Moniliophthora perniciosa FA553]
SAVQSKIFIAFQNRIPETVDDMSAGELASWNGAKAMVSIVLYNGLRGLSPRKMGNRCILQSVFKEKGKKQRYIRALQKIWTDSLLSRTDLRRSAQKHGHASISTAGGKMALSDSTGGQSKRVKYEHKPSNVSRHVNRNGLTHNIIWSIAKGLVRQVLKKKKKKKKKKQLWFRKKRMSVLQAQVDFGVEDTQPEVKIKHPSLIW